MRAFKATAVLSFVITLSALAAMQPAAAQGVPKEGRVDITSCWSGANSVIAFSKTHLAFSYEMTGTTRSNPPGGIFDMTAFRCVGLVNAIAGKQTGSATCEVVDKDGDKTLSQYLGEGNTYTATTLAGTGKYEGMTSNLVAEMMGQFPTIKPGTFQNCNRQTGTYKMK